MRYKSITISNPRGAPILLTVGEKFGRFEVVEIWSIETPESMPKEFATIIGTYDLIMRSEEGEDFSIANNQVPAGFSFCLNVTIQKLDVCPNGLAVLADSRNIAEFGEPLEVAS